MKKKTVIYIVEDAKSDLCRYQVENVMELMRGDKKWRVECFLKSEIEQARDRLDEASLVVILRQTAKDNIILDYIKEAQGRGVKVMYLLDDLIFDYRDLPLLMRSTNSRNVFYWSGYFWGIRRIAKKVDGFITTNDYLGEKLKRSFKKPYAVIPNSLSGAQVEASERFLKEKKKAKGFLMGYFSGSPTHTKDFKLIEGQLLRFLREYPESKLMVVGYMNFSEEAIKLINEGKIIFRKKVSPVQLQGLMGEVEVNLAPLVVNRFTNCKSELKFFEAGVVETTTIASPSYTFKKAISDGRDGMIAKKKEWFDKLKYLYENPKENKKMAKQAKSAAMKNYYGEKVKQKVENAFRELAK